MTSITPKSLQKTTYFPNGIRVGIGHTQMQNGEGVPISPLQMWNLAPFNDSDGNYVVNNAQTYNINAQGIAALNQSNITNYPVPNQAVLQLDCLRKVKIVPSAAITTDGLYQFQINGYDDRGVSVQDVVTFMHGQTFTAGLPTGTKPSTAFSLVGGVQSIILNAASTITIATTGANVGAGLALDFTIVGLNQNMQLVSEIVTIGNGDSSENSVNTYYAIYSITFLGQYTAAVNPKVYVASTVALASTVITAASSNINFVISNKAFYRITSIISNPSNITKNVGLNFNYTIGLSNSFAFPFFIPNPAFVNNMNINNFNVPVGVSIVGGYNFYALGAPNAGSTDARGFIAIPESENVSWLSALIYSYGADSYFNSQLSANNSNYFGNNTTNYISPQQMMLNIITPYYNSSDDDNIFAVNPSTGLAYNSNLAKPLSMGNVLTQYDITGVQYPGDLQIGNPAVNSGKTFNSVFPKGTEK